MTDLLTEAFGRFSSNGGGGPSWLAPIRREAFTRFATVGFPTARDEEWRFTPVIAIAQGGFRPDQPLPKAARVTREAVEQFTFGHSEWPRLVFVNGRFDPDLSTSPTLAEGVHVGSLAQAIDAGHPVVEAHLGRYAKAETTPFAALNTAFVVDGAFVHVPKGVTVPDPIQLVFVSSEATDAAIQPRNLVVVEGDARVSLVESYVTLTPGSRYFTNAVSEVVLGAQAWVEHSRIQRESEAAFHIGFTQVDQARDSHYRSFTLAMGGAIARHNLHVQMNDSNIESLLYGLYLTRGQQVVDNHTAIHHDHPHCNSWEMYKGVLDGRSRAVFNGKVFVTPIAQKTDAKQTNRNLLLSDGARVDTKPQLEIFADDVRCTHGATVGQLDDLPLFYALSRGIPREAAKQLLTYAFAAEVLEEVAVDDVRAELDRLLHARLAGHD